MKIATFNINDVNRRLVNLLDWLKAAGPTPVWTETCAAAKEQASMLRRGSRFGDVEVLAERESAQ